MTGKLNRRMELLEPVRTPDGGGGFITYYDPVINTQPVYAQITQISGEENMRASRLAARQVFRIIIRYRDDITSEMRLRDGGRIYDIRSVTPINGRRTYIEIIAELVTA